MENIVLELAGIVTAVLKENFASADKVDTVVFRDSKGALKLIRVGLYRSEFIDQFLL